MQAAIPHLGLAGPGAEEAQRSARSDNHAWLAVSLVLGYEEDRQLADRRSGNSAVTWLRRARALAAAPAVRGRCG